MLAQLVRLAIYSLKTVSGKSGSVDLELKRIDCNKSNMKDGRSHFVQLCRIQPFYLIFFVTFEGVSSYSSKTCLDG